MPDPTNDPIFVSFVAGTLLLSILTCLSLLAARMKGPLLRFEPRRLVPWNAAGGGLAVAMVWLAVWSALQGYGAPADQRNNDTGLQVTTLVVSMAPEVLIVGGVLAFMAIVFKADRRDFGLPANSHKFARDIVIGTIACLAALAPVLLILSFLMWLLRVPEMQSGHPLVKMLVDTNPDLTVMLLATLAAVVVAPVCEEITFRLLLQGWLERWEAQVVDNGVETATRDVAASEELRMTNEESAGEGDESPVFVRASSIDCPPPRGIGGMPYGWLPIAISSTFFGLAHLGYGPEPVPLFLLAVVLGYLYFRTHRIVPCIVAHAAFNSFAMVQLWWMWFHSSP